MRALAAVLVTLTMPALAAEYLQPKGAPELFVPIHNVTISVFAVQTPVGHGIGIFEKRGDEWYLCGQCLVSPEVPTMDAAVKAAGGPEAYVVSKRAAINAVLATRYPAKGVKRSDATIADVNEALVEDSVLKLVDGVPQLGPR
ncbi:MAG: hypothetical protein AB7E79_09100 [Rhodospirillaceae bacterium]